MRWRFSSACGVPKARSSACRRVTRSFDDRGNTAEYEATLRDHEWRITGETERFAGAFSQDGRTLEGSWERLKKGSDWVTWMIVRLSKVR